MYGQLASRGVVAKQRAVALLRAGLPLDLTARAAGAYVDQCQTLLAELGNTDALLTLKLLTAQTVALGHIDLQAAAESQECVEAAAEQLEVDVAEACSLLAWGYVHPAPEHAAARVAAAHKVLDIASAHDEDLLVPAAHSLLLVGLLEQGEIRALDSQLINTEMFKQRSTNDEGIAGTDPAKWFQVLRSILDGDVETAERQVEELYSKTQLANANALALFTTQRGMIRWMQGRIEGAEEGFLAARRAYPEQVLWAASLAWLWLSQGRTSSAEALLHSLPRPNELPRDRYWLATVVVLGEVALLTGSRVQAAGGA